MTAEDKKEIAALLRKELEEGSGCALGIKKETAQELISFADTWKACRRSMLVAISTIAVTGLLTALWYGLKTMVTTK